MVLLDSGAVSSVVGKHYLQRFCPGWRDFILPVETGVVHIKFFMKSIELKVRFVVMDNMSAKYFILGNDYLVAYKISLLNKERRQFTMGSKVFDFDESINAIEQTTPPESSSTRSETGASTAAIQEQLTTENVRNLNGRAETQTITGEHSDQESIAIITDLPIPNSLAQATLNAAAARRNFPPTTEFLF
ncbi:hypothetical protein PSTG_18307 [Puccinia striiformis f. sp. tritici PST-78]|uniref:Uncharacterized protein n=1 Tax=Puccinia striiformis f. sp. tritici PST-78 TaxID=1165861 RepID=A0A0L0UMN7_9BASI|nr:hypothetical protein PSTG_18307 [Puccinia striiformis f. sp. tritici PST-78]